MASNPATSQLPITSLRGGFNDTDPQHLLTNDQCTIANNVEFFHSSLGERRLGCESLDLTSASLTDETVIVHLSEFFPTTLVTAAEMWAIAATPSTSVSVARRNSGTWNTVSPDDAIDTAAPDIYKIKAATLNGKHFFAYHSAVDRLHVWDGTYLRRTGMGAPAAAPTAANGGGAGTNVVRYYRVRFVEMSGSTVLRRGEPSATLTYNPGSAVDVIVTKPATISEHETHWELEASADDANFYRIARTVVGTTTYDDTANPSTYATTGVLSEAVGAYLTQWSAKFIGVDGDRLIWGGHFTDTTKKSMVGWSPVLSDPGVGNEERSPIVDTGGTDIVNTKNLDPTDGGELTGISDSVNGAWYAFKWDHIYRMSRTSDETDAYEAITISKSRGAVPGSIISGMDELGRACIYFLDPQFGPSRIGLFGLQTIRGVRTTWRRANTLGSKVVACGVYYPDKQQVIWNIAADTNDSPTLGLKLQVTETRSDTSNSAASANSEGASRGWSLFDGTIATAYCMTIFHEVVSGDPNPLVYTLRARPFGGYLIATGIQRWDVGTTDNGTAFRAVIRTKPFIVAGLLQKWGALVGSLLAVSNAGLSVVVKLIRDFGIEESESITTDLLPEFSEPIVIKDLDNLHLSGARSIQVEFSDPE